MKAKKPHRQSRGTAGARRTATSVARQPRSGQRGLIVAAAALAVMGVLVWMLLPGDGRAAEAAPDTAAVLAGPPPVSIAPTSVDFGEVEIEQTITHTVELINTSDRALRIQAVRGNCSCVRGTIGGEGLIQPRGRVPLTVHFDTLSNPSQKTVGVNVVIAGFEEPVHLPVRAQIVRAAD